MREPFESQFGDAPREPQRKPWAIEGRAIAIGSFVGFLTTIFAAFFYGSLLASMVRYEPWLAKHEAVGEVMAFVFQIGGSVVAGFVAAKIARGRALLHAGLTGLALCAIWLFLIFFVFVYDSFKRSADIALSILFCLITVPAALFGGYAMMSLERNRDVKID